MPISGLRQFVGVSLLLTLASCQSDTTTATIDDLYTRIITFPNGKTVKVETMTREIEMARGMMFRDSLSANRGMLFIHANAAHVPYFTYQVRIPLDILWMDRNHVIVEISPNTPPCNDGRQASQCPKYGGHTMSQFVLELAAGEVEKNHLKSGDRLDF